MDYIPRWTLCKPPLESFKQKKASYNRKWAEKVSVCVLLQEQIRGNKRIIFSPVVSSFFWGFFFFFTNSFLLLFEPISGRVYWWICSWRGLIYSSRCRGLMARLLDTRAQPRPVLKGSCSSRRSRKHICCCCPYFQFIKDFIWPFSLCFLFLTQHGFIYVPFCSLVLLIWLTSRKDPAYLLWTASIHVGGTSRANK